MALNYDDIKMAASALHPAQALEVAKIAQLAVADAIDEGKTWDGQPVGGGFTLNPTTGLAETTVDGDVFVALPTNPSGQAVGEIGHRQNTLANLLTLAGVAGEISVPTDNVGVVLHNGVAGQATRLFSPLSPNTHGTNSLAFGEGSSTGAAAGSSIALGPAAATSQIGEYCRQGSIAGVVTREFQLAQRTVDDDDDRWLTTDGTNNQTGGLMIAPTGIERGIWDVEMLVVARQIGTNNWARFVRRAVVRIPDTGIACVMTNLTTPTPDVNSGLAGLAVLPASGVGMLCGINVVGLAATTIQWAGHVTLRGCGIIV